jgi:hypothetical protein
MQVSLDHKNDTIETLKKQMSELQTQHAAVVSEFAVMQAERKAIISKKSVKKITETV